MLAQALESDKQANRNPILSKPTPNCSYILKITPQTKQNTKLTKTIKKCHLNQRQRKQYTYIIPRIKCYRAKIICV